MDKPWYIDIITMAVVLAWMGWTFATMQQYGPSLELVVPAVVVGVVGILWIYGQRITYFRLGNRVVVALDSGPFDDTDPEDTRPQYRQEGDDR